MKESDYTYTQREWDRVVGWGQVPEEYKKQKKDSEEKQDE